MAGKVFFSVSMSLDGFIAPEVVPVEDVFSPEGQNPYRRRAKSACLPSVQASAR